MYLLWRYLKLYQLPERFAGHTELLTHYLNKYQLKENRLNASLFDYDCYLISRNWMPALV